MNGLDQELMSCTSHVNTNVYAQLRANVTNTLDVLPVEAVDQTNIDITNNHILSMRKMIHNAKETKQFLAKLHESQRQQQQQQAQQQPTYVAPYGQPPAGQQQHQPYAQQQHHASPQHHAPQQHHPSPQPGQSAQQQQQYAPPQHHPSPQPGQQQHQQYTQQQQYEQPQQHHAGHPGQQQPPQHQPYRQQQTYDPQQQQPTAYVAAQTKPAANVGSVTASVSTTGVIAPQLQAMSVDHRPWYVPQARWSEMIAENPGQEEQIAKSLEEDKTHWIKYCMLSIMFEYDISYTLQHMLKVQSERKKRRRDTDVGTDPIERQKNPPKRHEPNEPPQS